MVNKINPNIVKEGAQKSLEAVRVEFDRRKNESLGMNDSILGLRNNVTGIAASKLKSEIGMHENRISTLRKQLDEIRQQHGIFDFGYQINVLNEQLAEAQSNFLQEEGKLRVVERAEGLDDSIVVMIRANFNGAQQRKMYFEQQLASLLKVNQRYSAISGELESELELQRNTRSELQQIDFSVEPDLKTNRIKAMEQDFEFDQLQLRSLREQYQTALSNLLDPVPMAYVISPARPSYRKIYPYTIVNTLIGGISSALFGLFLLAYLEKRRSKA